MTTLNEENRERERRRRTEGLIALAVVQVFFGFFPVFVKLALGSGEHEDSGFSVHAIIFWRVSVAALVLGVLAFVRHGREFFPPRKDFGRLFACSLLGIVANQVLAVEGTSRTHAVHAGMLFTLIPVFTYVVAVGMRQETLSRRRSSGILLALVGAVVLVVARNPAAAEGVAHAANPALGNSLIALNCLAYAIYLVLARRLLDHLPTLVVIAWVFLLSVWVLPIFAWTSDLVPVGVSSSAVSGLTALVLLSTVIAYLINTYALARVSASTTAVFVYFQPLVAIVGAMALLGERPGIEVLFAAPCLFLGIGLVLARSKPANAESVRA